MNPTLSYLLGHRMWAISSVNVWGTLSDFTPQLLLTESDGAGKRILFGSFPTGGSVQQLEYADLIDARGNSLPAELTNPKVMVLPKGEVGAVVVGSETNQSFTLAKTTDTDQVAVCDLVVIEMG
jgi:hypothetical protein